VSILSGVVADEGGVDEEEEATLELVLGVVTELWIDPS